MIKYPQSIMTLYTYRVGRSCSSRTCKKSNKSTFGNLNLSCNQVKPVLNRAD
jgi:hypothetical protein